MTELEQLLQQEGLLQALQQASESVGMSVDMLVAKCNMLSRLARPRIEFNKNEVERVVREHNDCEKKLVDGCRDSIPDGAQLLIATITFSPSCKLAPYEAAQWFCAKAAKFKLTMLTCEQVCNLMCSHALIIGASLSTLSRIKDTMKALCPDVMRVTVEYPSSGVLLGRVFKVVDGFHVDELIPPHHYSEGLTDLNSIGTMCTTIGQCSDNVPELTDEQQQMLKEYLNRPAKTRSGIAQMKLE